MSQQTLPDGSQADKVVPYLIPLTSNSFTPGVVSISASGDNVIVPAVFGQSTKIHGLRFYVQAAVSVKIKIGTTVMETIHFSGPGGGLILDLRGEPYYITGINEAFVINLSAGVQLDGRIEYLTSA